MIGASGIQMVECSNCSEAWGSWPIVPSLNKPTTVLEWKDIYPGLNVLVQCTAWSFVLYSARVEVTGGIFLFIHRWQREECSALVRPQVPCKASGFLISETTMSRHRCGLWVVGWETVLQCSPSAWEDLISIPQDHKKKEGNTIHSLPTYSFLHNYSSPRILCPLR